MNALTGQVRLLCEGPVLGMAAFFKPTHNLNSHALRGPPLSGGI